MHLADRCHSTRPTSKQLLAYRCERNHRRSSPLTAQTCRLAQRRLYFCSITETRLPILIEKPEKTFRDSCVGFAPTNDGFADRFLTTWITGDVKVANTKSSLLLDCLLAFTC